MKWMPDALPPYVHVIVSTLPDVGGCLEALRIKYAGDKATYLELPTLSNHVGLFLVIMFNLYSQDANLILHSLLLEDHRSLTSAQQQLAIQHIQQCSLPLYIRVLCDILSGVHSYDPFPVCQCNTKTYNNFLLVRKTFLPQ